jgi:RNA polymerase sigma-70 factor (ECF subfamily)
VLNPNAFIFALARNLLRDRARRLHTKAEARSISFDAIDLRCEAPTPDRSLELVQLLQHVEQALAALNPRAREAFMLHRVHGDSHTEIAAQMDISVSMVEKHIMSAIRLLGSINA